MIIALFMPSKEENIRKIKQPITTSQVCKVSSLTCHEPRYAFAFSWGQQYNKWPMLECCVLFDLVFFVVLLTCRHLVMWVVLHLNICYFCVALSFFSRCCVVISSEIFLNVRIVDWVLVGGGRWPSRLRRRGMLCSAF